MKGLVAQYRDRRHEFELFRNAVRDYFTIVPALNAPPFPIIHSVKTRLKDEEHLRKKIVRKWREEERITTRNLFRHVTDLAGVRVLHLYQDQFKDIHEAIMAKVDSGDWRLGEDPVANSWDPEAGKYFKGLGLKIDIRETYYTSVHYLIEPPKGGGIVCELQVRTLFEEVWGEIDHAINYPDETRSLECREQLRVLAKLVSTGSRLCDAIFRSHKAYKEHTRARRRR